MHLGFYHHRAASLTDVACFLHDDGPSAFAYQGIGVFVLLGFAIAGVNRGIVMGRVIANLWVLRCRLHHFRQIAGGRHVLRAQASGLNKTAVVHTQLLCFAVHGRHKSRHAAWVSACQSMNGAVFTAHQANVQQFVTAQSGADRQAAARAFQTVNFRIGDGDAFIFVQARIQQHHGAHQFADGSDGAHAVDIFLVNLFARIGIHDQSRLRIQRRAQLLDVTGELLQLGLRSGFWFGQVLFLDEFAYHVDVIGVRRQGKTKRDTEA